VVYKFQDYMENILFDEASQSFKGYVRVGGVNQTAQIVSRLNLLI